MNNNNFSSNGWIDEPKETSVNSKSSVVEVLENTIKSLIFSKIDMSGSSSNKNILSSLEDIQQKLNETKNCNIYLVNIF